METPFKQRQRSRAAIFPPKYVFLTSLRIVNTLGTRPVQEILKEIWSGFDSAGLVRREQKLGSSVWNKAGLKVAKISFMPPHDRLLTPVKNLRSLTFYSLLSRS